jgi:signal transduction histidine kinase
LQRDVVARAFLVVWVLASAPYALPFDQPWLARYQRLVLFPGLITMVVIACFWGWRRLESLQERWFWALIGGGFGAWLLSYAPYYFVGEAEHGLGLGLAGELCYLLLYLGLLLAVDVRPHLGTTPNRVAEAEHWLKSLGAAILALAALAYFVVVPAATNPLDYATWVPSLLLYVALDAFVLIRFAGLAIHCTSPRWHVLYSGLGLATFLMLTADALESLRWTGTLPFQDGRVTDLIWTAPLAAYVVAARLRHHPLASPPLIPFLEAFESSPVRTGSFLLACALSAPTVHLCMYLAGPLDSGTRRPREWIVLATIVSLGALAGWAYRLLERERLVLRDRQQQLEAQLRHAQRTRTIGKLTEGIMHDLGNLMQVIGGRCEPLLAELPPGTSLRGDIEAIRTASRRITTLAVQFVQLMQVDFEEPRLVRLSDLVRDAEPLVRATVTDQVRVELRLRAVRDAIRVNPQQIERVLLALAANAHEAMPDGGVLVLETFDFDASATSAAQLGLAAGPYVGLSLADTGCGMSEETHARAFQPFFTTRPGADRIGLGLTSALHVASHYGGTVQLDSRPGIGTTVTLYLPRDEAQAVVPLPDGSAEDTLRRHVSTPHALAGTFSRRVGD